MKPPISIQGAEFCPETRHGLRRLVFGMRSDGEFPGGRPQKRKRFTLVRPVIVTKACNADDCGYWFPAFSFTPQGVKL